MTDRNPKIITSFQSRLEVDSAVRGLGNTTTDAELRQQAQQIAANYGEQALTPLLALLDTPSPQLRGGLGYLATFLERDKVVPALRSIAFDRTLPDRPRLAAITILERFLEIEPDPVMYEGMASPEELAVQSLREVMAEAQSNSLVLVEYLEQLSHEPADVLLTMVRSARRLEGPEAVEMLRLFAQDPNAQAAQEALHMLGASSDPSAAVALRTLLPSLPPALRPQGERSLQKLRLRGISAATPLPPPPGLRCLASPPDSQGNQVIWFLQQMPHDQAATVLRLLLTPLAGVVWASGQIVADKAELPPQLPVGALHGDPRTGGPRGDLMLEAPFDYGRHQVQLALEQNWEKAQPTPLAYRLLNPLLWQWTAMQATPPTSPQSDATRDATRLLSHPALAAWFFLTSEVYEAAERLLLESDRVSMGEVDLTINALQQRFAADEKLVTALQHHLRTLEEWLLLAGEPGTARQAHAAADTLSINPAEHPLLTQMCAQGLRIAMINLARGIRWQQSTPDR